MNSSGILKKTIWNTPVNYLVRLSTKSFNKTLLQVDAVDFKKGPIECLVKGNKTREEDLNDKARRLYMQSSYLIEPQRGLHEYNKPKIYVRKKLSDLLLSRRGFAHKFKNDSVWIDHLEKERIVQELKVKDILKLCNDPSLTKNPSSGQLINSKIPKFNFPEKKTVSNTNEPKSKNISIVRNCNFGTQKVPISRKVIPTTADDCPIMTQSSRGQSIGLNLPNINKCKQKFCNEFPLLKPEDYGPFSPEVTIKSKEQQKLEKSTHIPKEYFTKQKVPEVQKITNDPKRYFNKELTTEKVQPKEPEKPRPRLKNTKINLILSKTAEKPRVDYSSSAPNLVGRNFGLYPDLETLEEAYFRRKKLEACRQIEATRKEIERTILKEKDDPFEIETHTFTNFNKPTEIEKHFSERYGKKSVKPIKIVSKLTESKEKLNTIPKSFIKAPDTSQQENLISKSFVDVTEAQEELNLASKELQVANGEKDMKTIFVNLKYQKRPEDQKVVTKVPEPQNFEESEEIITEDVIFVERNVKQDYVRRREQRNASSTASSVVGKNFLNSLKSVSTSNVSNGNFKKTSTQFLTKRYSVIEPKKEQKLLSESKDKNVPACYKKPDAKNYYDLVRAKVFKGRPESFIIGGVKLNVNPEHHHSAFNQYTHYNQPEIVEVQEAPLKRTQFEIRNDDLPEIHFIEEEIFTKHTYEKVEDGPYERWIYPGNEHMNNFLHELNDCLHEGLDTVVNNCSYYKCTGVQAIRKHSLLMLPFVILALGFMEFVLEVIS